MRYDPEAPSCTLVLIGKFNPAIFSPAWFAKVGIISDNELEIAVLDKPITHPEIAQFTVNRRFRIEVQPTRFQMVSTLAPFISIADDVRSLFTRFLPHTPVSALGINFSMHFRLDTAEQRLKLGRALAPSEPWGGLGRRLQASTISNPSGVASLVLQESLESESRFRRVEVQPSRSFDRLRSVFIAYNDHFGIANARDEDGAAAAMTLLGSEFDKSEREYRTIVTDLMAFAESLS